MSELPPITSAGAAFALAVAEYAQRDLTGTGDFDGRSVHSEFEVAIRTDGSLVLTVQAHSRHARRVEVPADHGLAANLRGLLLAARAEVIA